MGNSISADSDPLYVGKYYYIIFGDNFEPHYVGRYVDTFKNQFGEIVAAFDQVYSYDDKEELGNRQFILDEVLLKLFQPHIEPIRFNY